MPNSTYMRSTLSVGTASLFLDEAISDARRDLKSGDAKEFKDDMKNANYALEETVKKDTSLFGGILLGVVMMLAKTDVSEMEVGRSFAWLSEKVYLSDTGKIEKIKMSLAGDFALQYIEKNVPGYAAPSKWLIERHTFPSLDYKEIASMIRLGTIPKYLPSISLGAFIAPYSKHVISTLPRMTPEEALKMVQMLNENPVGRLMLLTTGLQQKKPNDKTD